ncbi:hypothetical protein BDP81DRAFT_97092 [Colletotrichum phormii]|uniref:Uncharacterized protein n=1 Tax=Colletotrichum phormii TaxID=359342 RepID=A0AAI9ZKY9_9PEZI|nr:uncharacterized protein BDP81DRAFT_97092 [Colletotrichum phormii]KAK1625465.1 hypothetical protein BDP81DRAFT_97092 [Colletotrichum phormii]
MPQTRSMRQLTSIVMSMCKNTDKTRTRRRKELHFSILLDNICTSPSPVQSSLDNPPAVLQVVPAEPWRERPPAATPSVFSVGVRTSKDPFKGSRGFRNPCGGRGGATAAALSPPPPLPLPILSGAVWGMFISSINHVRGESGPPVLRPRLTGWIDHGLLLS